MLGYTTHFSMLCTNKRASENERKRANGECAANHNELQKQIAEWIQINELPRSLRYLVLSIFFQSFIIFIENSASG